MTRISRLAAFNVRVLGKLSLCILSSLALTGCASALAVQSAEVKLVSENKTAAERQKFRKLGDDFHGRVNYARALADEYIKYADSAATAENLAAAGILAAAATAAGGMLYGAHVDLLKGAGLAAGTITATRGYAEPVRAASDLLNAAEGLVCIANAGRVTSKAVQKDWRAAGVLDDGIRAIRLGLRKKLLRDSPDYNDILTKIKDTYREKNVALMNSDASESLEVLEVKVNVCVLKASGV